MKPSAITSEPSTIIRGTPGVASSPIAERFAIFGAGRLFGNMNHNGVVKSAGIAPTMNIGRQVCSSTTK
jgi:hypothetical protein